jgi:hypothetical protein
MRRFCRHKERQGPRPQTHFMDHFGTTKVVPFHKANAKSRVSAASEVVPFHKALPLAADLIGVACADF